MAVTEQTPLNTYTANGATTVFAFSFLVLQSGDLVVKVTDTNGNVSTKALGADYSVAGLGVSSGGTVTFTSAPASGYGVSIYRDTDISRSTDYQNNGDFLAGTVNNDFDRALLILQEVVGGGKASLATLRVPPGESVSALPSAAARASRVLAFDSAGAPVTIVGVDSGSAAALALDLANSSNPAKGPALVGWLRSLTSAVATTVYQWMNWQDPNVFEWMTSAQIADYKARTAVSNLAGALDLTAPIQAAIYASYAAGQNLYFPPGAAKVTGVQVPTNTALYEDRGDAWRMYGAGAPQPFVRFPRGGTVIISETNAPVLRYQQQRAMPTAGGNSGVVGIRFEQRNAAATAAVVLWDSLSEDAEFSRNVIIQFGTGNGFETTYQIKGNIERNFAMYGGYFTATRSAAGIGFNIPSAADSGLLTVRKNSARSFLWGYVHGDGTNDSSGALFEQNECSDCTNGAWNKAGCTGATWRKTYTEGITGTCIKDEGTMTTIAEGMHYLGFAIGIDASTPSNYGTSITNNYLETAGPNCTLVKVGSGGPNKVVSGNHLLFSTSGGSVAGVVGIEVTGLDPRLDLSSNAFNPRAAWTGGAGTTKILDSSTATAGGSRAKGNIGFGLVQQGTNEYPAMNQGALALATFDTITGTVSSQTIQADYGGEYQVTFGSGTTVSKIADGGQEGRIISLRITNGNCTFSHNTNLKLAGSANWTPGANGGRLLLRVYGQSGGFVVAEELARTAY